MATPSLAMIPSGYKASKVYSVLPESGVGDFTFSRGSNATRVNKDGLIEEVLELGEELVINGGFDTDSDWTKGTGWSISDGKVIATNAPNLQRLQNSGNDASVIGKTYKYSISVSNVSGAYSLYVFGVYTLSSSSTEGTIEGYVTATSTNGTVFIAAATSGGLVSATIDNVSVKEVISFDLPRLDYTDSSCPSLLLEPQSTNLVEYSNDFSGLSGGFVTPNYGISPEGLSASRVLFTGANQSMSSGTSLGTGVVCNFSAYVKGVQGKTIKFAAGGVDISHTFSGEWERLSGSATSINSSWNFNTYGGATARDFQVCGTQLEEQSYSTSYIPTNGAIATRLADVCTDAGTSATFNDSEGVLYVNTATLQEGVTEKIISLSDGTTSNNIYFSFSGTANTIYSLVVSGGSTQASLSTTVSQIQQNKLLIKYKSNDISFWLNGFKVGFVTSANTPSGLKNLSFSYPTNTINFYGNTKEIGYYNSALTDSELEQLTSWTSFSDMANGQQYSII